jgi:hypothetical protein
MSKETKIGILSTLVLKYSAFKVPEKLRINERKMG